MNQPIQLKNSLLGSSASREPINSHQISKPASSTSIVRVLAPHLLVPHISQDTGASGDSLLLPASSAGGGVVVGWAALHVCDFAESGGVGLPCDVKLARRWK